MERKHKLEICGRTFVLVPKDDSSSIFHIVSNCYVHFSDGIAIFLAFKDETFDLGYIACKEKEPEIQNLVKKITNMLSGDYAFVVDDDVVRLSCANN